jgi:uncharacterized protein (DUF2062 family)
MVHFTREAVRRWLNHLLHIEDTPQRTAAAYALGVFFGFSPFFGLHTIGAIACAFLFNLNRVAALLGVYSNLPWFIAPYYALTTALGAVMLGTTMPPEFGSNLRAIFDHSPLDIEFWRGTTMFKSLFWPYIVGSTTGALILALVAYRAALAFVIARRKHHAAEAGGEANG